MSEIGWPGAEFLCSCNAESVRVMRDEDGMVEFAVWTYGVPRGASVRQRVRWVWRVLRHGEPYGDQVVLESTEARKLALLILGAPEDAFLTWTTGFHTNTTAAV